MKKLKLTIINILLFSLLFIALHWVTHRYFAYSIEPCILIVDLDYGVFCDQNDDQEAQYKNKHFRKKNGCYKCDHSGLVFHNYDEYKNYQLQSKEYKALCK